MTTFASKTTHSLDRRGVLRGAAAGGVALAAGGRAVQADPKVLNIAAFGGVINDYLIKVFAEPYEAQTGVKVNFGTGASLALAKLQRAPAQWDIVLLSGAEYIEAVEQKIIVPYDYNIIGSANMPPDYKQPYGVKFSLFLFVMAWDKRVIPDGREPQSWADFWDTNRYKGKRSLYTNLSDGSTLEAALLADGVPLDKLYPLDVDRALRSLERLGRENITWYTTNQEPIQHLTSGASPLADCFNGRVIIANKAGAQLGFTAAYSAVSGNPYCVLEASANKQEAFRFLDFMLNSPKADADYITLTNYAIPNNEALAMLPQSVLDILPTSPKLKDKVFIKDDAWWGANLTKTTAKFKEWQLSG